VQNGISSLQLNCHVAEIIRSIGGEPRSLRYYHTKRLPPFALMNTSYCLWFATRRDPGSRNRDSRVRREAVAFALIVVVLSVRSSPLCDCDWKKKKPVPERLSSIVVVVARGDRTKEEQPLVCCTSDRVLLIILLILFGEKKHPLFPALLAKTISSTTFSVV